MLKEQINFADVNWPDGRDTVGAVQLERDLRRKLKRYGFGLVADRTTFTDARYQNGYMIVGREKIKAGRNFDLSLADVMQWANEHCRKQD